VVLYQMLAGQLPFDSPEPLSIIYMHVNEPPRSPIKLQEHIPKKVAKIILKLLAKNPVHRYQSGSELVAALDSDDISDAVTQLFRRIDPQRRPTFFGRFSTFFKDKPSLAEVTLPPPLPSRSKPRYGLMAAVAAGALLGATLLAWLLVIQFPKGSEAPSEPEATVVIDEPPGADADATIPDEIPSALPLATLTAHLEPEVEVAAEPTPPPALHKKPVARKPPPVPQAAAAKVPSALELALNEFAFVAVAGGELKRSGRGFRKYDVMLSGFEISATEVTQKLWQAAMDGNPSCNQGPDHPVENVSFSEWKNARA